MRHGGGAFALRSLVLASAIVAVGASPAAAHATAQVPATDYAVTIRAVTPTVPGLHVRVVDDGTRIEVRNESRTEITVLGYGEPHPEPYLRVGPRGVFRNERSPAVFWNRQAVITGEPPARFDASKPPEWRRISGGDVVRWHDHRAHYQGGAPRGDASRVVLRWTVPLRQGDRTITIAGDVRYLPPPSAVPYLLLAAVLAVGLVLAGRTRKWIAALATSVALLTAGAASQLVGEWGATTLSLPSRVGEHVYVFLGLALALGALGWLVARRARPYDTTPIALLAGVALLLASGLAGLPLLTHTVLPSTLPDAVVRVLVATTIGSGVATIVVAAMRLRPPYAVRATDQDSSTATPILRSMYAEKNPR